MMSGKTSPATSSHPARLAGEPLSQLLTAVHQSLRLDQLASRYLAAVPGVISANSFAFYTFDPQTGRPTRLGERGGVQRFVARYEEFAFTLDPLLSHTDKTLQPAHERLLFSDSEWQGHPLRTALNSRRLMRMLEAPVVLDQRRVGSLFFTRRPEAPPFTDDDLTAAGLIASHVGVATRNALLFTEVEQRAKLAEGALELIGGGLLLTDGKGNVRFANRTAERLLEAPSQAANAVEAKLRENLVELGVEGRRVVVSSAPLREKGSKVILRSQHVPARSDRVATFLYPQVEREKTRFSHLVGLLTPREVEVLELIAEGLQNKEIARRLVVSTNTVRYYLRRMFARLEVRSRAELLAKASQAQTPGA